jgi:hypothetical protein
MAYRGRKAARKTPYRLRQSEELEPQATPGRNAISLPRTESVPVMGLESLSLTHAESNECTRYPNGTTAAPYGHGAESQHRDGATHAAATASRTSDWDYSYDLSFVETHGRSSGLPFMKRNLRKGFDARFTQSNGRSGNFPPLPLFFHDNEDRSNQGDTSAWKFTQELRRLECPFCALFDPFATITHLLRHIEWDHQAYRVSCLRSLGDVSPERIGSFFMLTMPIGKHIYTRRHEPQCATTLHVSY